MMHVIRLFLSLVLLVSSALCVAKSDKEVTFHAKFISNISELHIAIPSALIEPTIKAHYSHLADSRLSQKEKDIYLEMYLRETVKLQYGAFPMALGESGIRQEAGMTKLVMKLAGLPKEARELLVHISSFSQIPAQKNVFQITKSYYKQSFALNNANAFSANVPL